MTIRYLLNKIEECYRTAVGHASVGYSQDGDDIIFNNLFADIDKGFYIDIGAHHPYRFSNTYLLYKKGWSGINVDASPGSMKIFDKVRRRDINLEVAVSERSGYCYLYQFLEPALNFISEENDSFRSRHSYKKTRIKCITLKELFKKYVDKQTIDLLLIDTEGHDLKVLKSNDWSTYKPNVVMVELDVRNVDDVLKTDVHNFLHSKKYKLAYKTYRNVIYIKE